MTDSEKKNSTPGEPIRVLIADDHRCSRSGLRALLSTLTQVKVVGEATDGQEAIRLTGEMQPDVVLMDAHMPVMDGLEATRRVKSQWPDVRVIMLTVYSTRRDEALAAGADAFLIKGCPVEQMCDAMSDHPGQFPNC